MKIHIHGPKDVDIARLQQTIMFYLSRLDLNVTSLHFHLREKQSDSGHDKYRIVLFNPRTGDLNLEGAGLKLQLAIEQLVDLLEQQIYQHQVEQIPALRNQAA